MCSFWNVAKPGAWFSSALPQCRTLHRGKGVGNAAASGQVRLLSYMWFLLEWWCAKRHTNGHLLRADLRPAALLWFLPLGSNSSCQEGHLCPRLPHCPVKNHGGEMPPSPLSQRAHLSHFLGCNKKHLQALLNWCKSGVTSLVLEGPNTVSDKNEAKCSCLNPSL